MLQTTRFAFVTAALVRHDDSYGLCALLQVNLSRAIPGADRKVALNADRWSCLTSVGMVESERIIGTETSREVRYFISSLPGDDAKKFGAAVRRHWEIENNLHWVLDVAFREDASRVRKDNAAENVAMLRHVALNLLKADKTTKAGVQTRRKKAGWSENYLARLLGVGGAN